MRLLSQPRFEQRARPNGRRKLRIERGGVQLDKIGDRAFERAQARPALPASRQMSPNLRFAARVQFAVGGENQILIGAMTVWMHHS
jgi:hypothetical protein